MSVDITTVRRVAHLARIKVSDAEAERLVDELNVILGFVAQLDQVDVAGVEPMTAVGDHSLPRRADVVTDGFIPDKVLGNAPSTEDGFFLVPRVVE